MSYLPRCGTCKEGIRWVSVSAGYEHLQPSACADSAASPDPVQGPETLLATARCGISAAGQQVAAHLRGQGADLAGALDALADALDAVAFLEAWDQPPDPCAVPVWRQMARRHPRGVSQAG